MAMSVERRRKGRRGRVEFGFAKHNAPDNNGKKEDINSETNNWGGLRWENRGDERSRPIATCHQLWTIGGGSSEFGGKRSTRYRKKTTLLP